MYNPFLEKIEEGNDDRILIKNALSGSKSDLEELILRHQAWIFNIAVRMTLDRIEAEDVTQEILIKVITNLANYDADKGAFRTWLYRIVANHVLSIKKNSREIAVSGLADNGDFGRFFQELKDTRVDAYPENRVIANEAKIACLAGMLICLDRKQRLVFILGVMFNISDKLGSEILDVSRENYRKILSRARSKIYNFFNNSCSLLDESNPCKCSKQVDNLINLGLLVSSDSSTENISYKLISNVVQEKVNDFKDNCTTDFIQLYREQPFLEAPDFKSWIGELLKEKQVQDLFQLH